MDESEEKQNLYYDLRDEIRKIDDSLSKLRDHLLDVIDAKWDVYAESKKIEGLPPVKDMKIFVDKINSAHKSKTLHYDYYNTCLDNAAHFKDLFRIEKSEFETFFDVDFISVLNKIKNEDIKTGLRKHNDAVSKIKSCSQKDADELYKFCDQLDEIIEQKGYVPTTEYTNKLNEIRNTTIKNFLISFQNNPRQYDRYLSALVYPGEPTPRRKPIPRYDNRYSDYQSTKRKELQSEIRDLDKKIREKRGVSTKSENIFKLRPQIEELLSPIKDNDYGRALRHGLLGVYENIEKLKSGEIKLEDIKKIVDVIVEKNIPFKPTSYKAILREAEAAPSLYADNAIPSDLKSKTQSPKPSTDSQPQSFRK